MALVNFDVEGRIDTLPRVTQIDNYAGPIFQHWFVDPRFPWRLILWWNDEIHPIGQGATIAWQDKSIRFITPPPGSFEAKNVWPAGVRPADEEWVSIVYRSIAQLPKLVVSGQFFALETGDRFSARQGTAFNAYARFLDEGGDAIRPVLEQYAKFFNLLRVWTLYDLRHANIGRLMLEDHPDLYDRIPDFVNLCAEYGQYVEFTAYTSWNDPFHWPRLCDAALKCPTLPLLEYVNEHDQYANYIDPQGRQIIIDAQGTRIVVPGGPTTWHTQAPAPLLSSHGSNGSEARPVEPFWSYQTFHTNLAFEEQRKIGHNAMEIE